MNKVKRAFTITGLAVAAGLAMGAGPASAAPAAPAAAGTAVQAATGSAVQVPAGFRSRDRIVGYYRSVQACNRAGKIGEFRKKWDDFDCDRVQRGPKRGWVALEAQWNVRGHGHFGPQNHGAQNHGPQGHGPRNNHR